MKGDMPPPVEDRYEHWWTGDAPPALSPRCLWWLEQLNGRRWTLAEMDAELPDTCEGYDTSAELWGVYIWEWCNILWHVEANVRWWARRDAEHPPLDTNFSELHGPTYPPGSESAGIFREDTSRE